MARISQVLLWYLVNKPFHGTILLQLFLAHYYQTITWHLIIIPNATQFQALATHPNLALNLTFFFTLFL